MKRHLISNLPAVLGAVVLLTGGTGAAAYALVGSTSSSPATSGNTLPIDDNHARVSDTPAVPVPPPAQDHAVKAQPEVGDDRGLDAPAARREHGPAAPTSSRAGGATTESGSVAPAQQEDHSGSESGHGGSGDSGSGSGSGRGSDDGGGHS